MKIDFCKLIICSLLLPPFAVSCLRAGLEPTITPNGDIILGETKSLTFSGSGGQSDAPDYEAPCPPWTLVSESDFWNWSSSGNAINITPSGNTADVYGTQVGEGTIYVNRNDSYSDATAPNAVTDEGTPSPDSASTTVHVVKPALLDNAKWFYFGNPENPVPGSIEQVRFWIIGNPGEVSYSWTKEGPLEFETLSYSANNDVIMARATDGPSSVSVTAHANGNNLGEIDTEIYIADFAGNGLNSVQFVDDGWVIGWDQYNMFSIRDSNGGLIPEGIGINETFSTRNNYISNTWPSPAQVNATTETGGGIDHYGVKKLVFQVLVNPTPESGNSDKVFKIKQQYRIGSSTSGQGTLIQEHYVVFHKGHASIE